MTSVAKRYAAPWLEQSMRQAASLASVPGLSADAVLCVRHLSARIDTHALRHGGGLLNTASKVSRQLQILASEARRPAHEVVPESAEAVLFDDPAEMLACAARDWLDGQFSRHWWWRSLLGNALTADVFAHWRQHPMDASSALRELGARAEEFCRRLPPSDAADLRDLLRAQSVEPRDAAPRRDTSTPALKPAADDSRQQLVAHARSLTLPASLRHADAVDALATTPSEPSKQETNGIRKATHRMRTSMPDARENIAAVPRAPTPESPTHGHRMTRQTGNAPPTPEETRPPNSALPPPSNPATLGEAQSRRRRSSNSPLPAAPTGTTPPDPLASLGALGDTGFSPSATPAASFIDAGKAIETRYGGVLYLLNAAIHLGFYPDFTQPTNASLALSPWEFLARVGERLAGRGLRQDALWSLLAALAAADHRQAERPTPKTNPPPTLPEALRLYQNARQVHTSSPPTWSAWIACLLPPLRRRLAVALGVPSRTAGALLCCQPARVQYRDGRLDAHFNLNEHPVAIRLSGLDRDPGWLPAAGCDLRFIYDA